MGNIVYITLLNVHTHNNEMFVVLIQLPSHVQFFVTPWTAACQASLSPTISRSLPKFMSIESVMPSNHLILCCPLLLPSVFSSIRVFSNESSVCIRYWSFRFSIRMLGRMYSKCILAIK